jgi:two-component system cell cycle response regulator
MEAVPKASRQPDLTALTTALTEIRQALTAISSGDPSYRISENGDMEPIRSLKQAINATAESCGEMVAMAHEFAIGLAELFDVFHRVGEGDLTARMQGHSDMELINLLKERANQMIHSVSREIQRRKAAREALGVLHKELEHRVEQRTAQLSKSNKKLRRQVRERRQTVNELRLANRKIVEQQRALVQGERMNVLVQMAGATAHELNQPLTVLLANIDLLNKNLHDPKRLSHYLSRVETAGTRIAEIVRKISNIRHDDVRPYIGPTEVIDLDQKVKILLVDNLSNDLHKLTHILDANSQIEVTRAGSIAEAEQSVERNSFDVIFSVHVLGDGNSFSLIDHLQERRVETPVVVFTEKANEVIASQVIRAGACDSMPVDQIDAETVYLSIGGALEKARLKRQTEMIAQRIGVLTTRDKLTGLLTRQHFMELLGHRIAVHQKGDGDLALFIADVDGMKEINDRYGYSAGNRVLRDVAGILSECIEEGDLACRYGGQEFMALLRNTGAEKARRICEEFKYRVKRQKFRARTLEFSATITIGYAAHQQRAQESVTELIEKAYQALAAAKAKGFNRVAAYSPHLPWRGLRLGRLLVSEGLISERQLDKALSEQKQRLGETLVNGGRLDPDQLDEALKEQEKSAEKLGQILKRLGHATTNDVVWALKAMKRKLGVIMQENGFLTHYELHQALARQYHRPRRIGLHS